MSTPSRFVLIGNPRCGTTYLATLLSSHPDVEDLGEPLNDEVEIPGNDYLGHIEELFGRSERPVSGFKCFPEQLTNRNIRVDDLIHNFKCKVAFVAWRKNFLEMFVSFAIAKTTGVWYSEEKSTTVHRITVDEQVFLDFADITIKEWQRTAAEWPIEVTPFFVRYEDLSSDASDVVGKALSQFGLSMSNFQLKCRMQRQNPASVEEKITNYQALNERIKEFTIDVPRVFADTLLQKIPIPSHLREYLPNREPPVPSGGFLYPVAKPFLPDEAKRNVMDALAGGCVSSVGYWPKKLSAQLQELFNVPVAQTCSNGFTALMLAFQAAGVTKNDEIIMPAMTMIAIPNSVHFLGGRIVLADNAPDSYNPELEQILQVATDKTKVVIISHTYGVPMQTIQQLVVECKKRGWILIEDIAECVGVKDETTGQYLGTFGDFACASLYANKIVHAGDGGFVLAKNAKFESRLQCLSNHGFTRSFHFLHLEPAINAKINGLGAALACGVLGRIDEIRAHRSKIAKLYRQFLAETPLQLMPKCGMDDTPWVFGCKCPSKSARAELRSYLAEHGVETRDYFLPLHVQPAVVNNLVNDNQRYPEAEKLGSCGFYLPLFTDLTEDDVEYICSVILEFYGKRGRIHRPPIRKAVKDLRIDPGSLTLQVATFDNCGTPVRYLNNQHVLFNVIDATHLFNNHLLKENWSSNQQLTADINSCIDEADNELKERIRNHFEPMLLYLKNETDFEPPVRRPWLVENLNDNVYDPLKTIATTTDKETLQFLVWLIKRYPIKVVLELGSWMGYSSSLMAGTLKRKYAEMGNAANVYALDTFTWHKWMSESEYFSSQPFAVNTSYIDLFQNNMRITGVSDIVHPYQWSIESQELPDEVRGKMFDLIFVDCSQEASELETIWQTVISSCIPGKTVIVFNGFMASNISFFNDHHHELKSLYKPHSIAKAYLYQPVIGITNPLSVIENNNKRKMKFLEMPNWPHHHQNAFIKSVDLLKSMYHSEQAEVAFLASAEDYICNHIEEGIDQPWIGIIHHVPEYSEMFYYPDLNRLCHQHHFLSMMQNCLGLFTLTQVQAEYLRAHLPMQIPICPLTYPSCSEKTQDSNVCEEWSKESRIKLAFIGSFARDVDFFYRAIVPNKIEKVLVLGDSQLEEWSIRAPKCVKMLPRLDAENYEQFLLKCLPFLALKLDGAANTLVVECIQRNVPIVAPKLPSCMEYLGNNYPLLYQPENDDLTSVLTEENVKKAVEYLQQMDKTRFTFDYFHETIEKSAVMRMIPPSVRGCDYDFNRYDLTICICSYKRTHNLVPILNQLWHEQTFKGRFEILIWNNNTARSSFLRKLCDPYLTDSSIDKRRLELIQSTENHYCTIRMAVASLMRSNRLLICDDDVQPTEDFMNFFYNASLKYPEDVLCVRGHKFYPHKLDVQNPDRVWVGYEDLRFINDNQSSQTIHFVHADACLLPISAVREWTSVPLPDPTFGLVDDYWMSFVLNYKFQRKLRKLQCDPLKPPLTRTDDSDTVGLALHTRPEVKDAKIRMYIYHMLRGWPNWPETGTQAFTMQQLEELKRKKWSCWNNNKFFAGYNISSQISQSDIEDLRNIGIHQVRIGAVGVKKERNYELANFLTQPRRQLDDLLNTIDLLAEKDISVVITLDKRIANAEIWSLIAAQCARRSNVIGYDLINEPATDFDRASHWTEISQGDQDGVVRLTKTYKEMIDAILKTDPITPIILESSYWGHIDAMPRLKSILMDLSREEIKDRICVSFHFYEPMIFTRRNLNKGRYPFPGKLPLFPESKWDFMTLDENWIEARFRKAIEWCKEMGVPVMIGEIGVARDNPNATTYLETVINTARKCHVPVFLFSFRDCEWEAMDYELGTEREITTRNLQNPDSNPFVKVINDAITNQ